MAASLPCYDLIREDHLSNSKRPGPSTSLKILDIRYLQKCIIFELKLAKNCKIILYMGYRVNQKMNLKHL